MFLLEIETYRLLVISYYIGYLTEDHQQSLAEKNPILCEITVSFISITCYQFFLSNYT